MENGSMKEVRTKYHKRRNEEKLKGDEFKADGQRRSIRLGSECLMRILNVNISSSSEGKPTRLPIAPTLHKRNGKDFSKKNVYRSKRN